MATTIKLREKDGDDIWSGETSLDETDLSSVTEGAVIVGNSSAVGSELDASGDTKILVGNGTTITSAALSGDVTMANTGAVTIGSEKVTSAMQKVPKMVVYQETTAVAGYTDNGDTTGQIDLSTTIPAGAVVLNATVHSITGFAGDTTATLQIGDGTDVDRYSTGTPSVFTTAAAGVDMGVPSGTKWHTAAITPRLTITGTADFTSIVTDGNGTLVVTIFYLRPV